MRIQTKKNKKKSKIIISSVALLLILCAGVFAWFSPAIPFFGVTRDRAQTESVDRGNIDYEKPTSDQVDISDKTKRDFIQQKYKTEGDSLGEDTQAAGVISITSATQSGDVISVRAIVENASQGGTCKAVLTKGVLEVVRTAGVQSNGSYQVCQGFDIPMSDLEAGEWVISVTYTAQSKTTPVSKGRVTVGG